MAAKYSIPYKDYFQNTCRVDITPATGWDGETVQLRAVLGGAFLLSYENDIYEPLANSKASISVYQQEDTLIDILELQTANDRDFIVEWFFNGSLKWSGFLVPEGIVQTFMPMPFVLNLNATDGLMLMSGIPYTHEDLTGGKTIINYFRHILFTKLGINIPLRWISTLSNDGFSSNDALSEDVNWGQQGGEGYTDIYGNTKSCGYIIEEMLRSISARLYQSNGRWVIERINDVSTGSYNYSEISGTSGYSITTGSASVNKSITGNGGVGDYFFIQEDPLITVEPALKSVIVTYDQDQRSNVLPNGNMDIVEDDKPIYWETNNLVSTTMESAPSLFDSVGYSVKITTTVSPSLFRIKERLPIDTLTLYKNMQLGFKVSPVDGWVLDPVTDTVDWSAKTFELTVRFTNNDATVWTLNKFGFWENNPGQVCFIMDTEGVLLNDVVQIDFNAFQNIPLISTAIDPIGIGNSPYLEFIFTIPEGVEIQFDDIYMNVETNSDVYSVTYSEAVTSTKKEEIELKISSSHNGFYVSNYMTNYSESGEEKFFSDSVSSGVVLTEMVGRAIIRNRYASSLVFEGSIYGSVFNYGEIYTISTLTGKKFVPLNAELNSESNTTKVTLMEIRNDDVDLTVKHYGSNDKTINSN